MHKKYLEKRIGDKMAEHLSEEWKNTEGTPKDELPKFVGDQYATGEE